MKRERVGWVAKHSDGAFSVVVDFKYDAEGYTSDCTDKCKVLPVFVEIAE